MNQKTAQVLRYWFDLRQDTEVTVLFVSQISKKISFQTVQRLILAGIVTSRTILPPGIR
jgi:site-specific recombinase XerC